MCSSITRLFIITVLYSISLAAYATPMVFNFTGTVSGRYLMDEVLKESPFIFPEWNGKYISGSMIMDLEGVESYIQDDEMNWYLNFNRDNSEQWLKFIINAPDGTIQTIAGPREYLASVDTNVSAAHLHKSDDTTDFFAERALSNKPARHLDNLVRLGLMSTGENHELLITSLDFNTVEIHPELANYCNFVLVNYKDSNGKQFNYTFGVDSITRVKTEIPESGSLMLMMLGFAGLMETVGES